MTVVFNPLLSNVVLRLEPEPERSTVIHVQKTLVDLARFGTITAVGPEVRDVRVGHRVLASITAGVELSDGVVMVKESAILGVEHE